jgi:hypothetical protein
MQLKALIKIADEAYPDGLIAQAHKDKRRSDNLGDGLARFIADELSDTYDARQPNHLQLADAADVMQCAMDQIRDIYDALVHRVVIEDEITKIKETPKEELPLLMEHLKYPDETKAVLIRRLKGR